MQWGLFADAPGCVRLSTCLRRLREQGAPPEAAAELERIHEQHGSCVVHGLLADPVIGLVGKQIAICCPWCSGADVQALWEAEGKQVLG
jgi:hypothetical protein